MMGVNPCYSFTVLSVNVDLLLFKNGKPGHARSHSILSSETYVILCILMPWTHTLETCTRTL